MFSRLRPQALAVPPGTSSPGYLSLSAEAKATPAVSDAATGRALIGKRHGTVTEGIPVAKALRSVQAELDCSTGFDLTGAKVALASTAECKAKQHAAGTKTWERTKAANEAP
jgi:hypothetical protein